MCTFARQYNQIYNDWPTKLIADPTIDDMADDMVAEAAIVESVLASWFADKAREFEQTKHRFTRVHQMFQTFGSGPADRRNRIYVSVKARKTLTDQNDYLVPTSIREFLDRLEINGRLLMRSQITPD